MTDEDSLYDRWQQHKDDVGWVQRHRDALEAAADVEIPRGKRAIGEWLADHKGVVTRRLAPDDSEE